MIDDLKKLREALKSAHPDDCKEALTTLDAIIANLDSEELASKVYREMFDAYIHANMQTNCTMASVVVSVGKAAINTIKGMK